jgi:methoxymalonate biosynthesis protein
VTGPASRPDGALIKCVVWDLDQTLLSGVYLESPQQPPAADPVLAGVLRELADRGILHAIASKNPPAAAAHAARATGREFAASECGWGHKSEAVIRIAEDLGIGFDALAFVDDDPYERAEVSSALPQVLVLSPEDAADAPGWPEFSPPVVTDEARRRGQLYLDRRRRQEAERAFAGSREEFLRWAGTQVTIVAAAGTDLPRLAELAVRTRQFNSAPGQPPAGQAPGQPAVPGEDWFRTCLAAPDQDVVAVWLRDSFSDDGLVGGCVVDRGAAGTWTVRLLMVSCRAMGRGVIDALLTWLVRSATRSGAARLDIPCLLTERNVPLRLALASARFRAAEGASAGAGRDRRPMLFSRPLGGPLPSLPAWVTTSGGAGAPPRPEAE